jgi:hypothetical protein
MSTPTTPELDRLLSRVDEVAAECDLTVLKVWYAGTIEVTVTDAEDEDFRLSCTASEEKHEALREDLKVLVNDVLGDRWCEACLGTRDSGERSEYGKNYACGECCEPVAEADA